MSPVKSKSQAGFLGAEYARKKKGKKGKTKMSNAQLKEYLEGTKYSKLPKRVRKRRG